MAARIDIKKVNATRFRFDVSCRINDRMRAELEAFLDKPIEAGKGVAFGVIHRKGEDEWVNAAYVEYSEEEGPHIHAYFGYGLKDIPPPPRKVPKPYKLLQIINMAEDPLEFRCRASFLYKGGAEKSIIQLPIPVFKTEKAIFHEIKGLEVSRTEPDEEKCDIRISLAKNKSIRHSVTFLYRGRARPGIEGDIFKRAVKISKQFLK
ncbi:hypothetical protein ES703_79273 [subsurface metagenome]